MNDPLFDITGRSILVAGGAQGIGEALCGMLAERGASVVVADRLGDEAVKVADSLPGKGHFAVSLDVTDEKSVEAAIEEIIHRAGRLDIMVNSAGVADFGPATSLSKELFERTIAVNLTGAFVLSRCVARSMLEQGEGSIIHLASVSSKVVNPQYSAYSSSKAGLSQLVRILALEWADQGVRINAIGPAVTQTPLTEGHVLANEKMRETALSKIPMARLGQPDDIFGVVVLLASPASRFITGQTLYVDGGRTLL
ncbi:MAG: gluconate 5-dehydrogenase [marine bacterium B5-7]|nr:MAG: gluconate 5-dehydrogenase [marine bacterium B5-7]